MKQNKYNYINDAKPLETNVLGDNVISLNIFSSFFNNFCPNPGLIKANTIVPTSGNVIIKGN